MTTGSFGTSPKGPTLPVGTCEIFMITSMPETTLPNTA